MVELVYQGSAQPSDVADWVDCGFPTSVSIANSARPQSVERRASATASAIGRMRWLGICLIVVVVVAVVVVVVVVVAVIANV